MKLKQMLYWTTTSFIALETFAGGLIDLTHGRTGVVSGPTAVEVVTSLGYPVYVLGILGILKIPGAIVLVLPGFLRLKEWAYAGIVFELTGAAASLAVRGHPERYHRASCLPESGTRFVGASTAKPHPRNRLLGPERVTATRSGRRGRMVGGRLKIAMRAGRKNYLLVKMYSRSPYAYKR